MIEQGLVPRDNISKAYMEPLAYLKRRLFPSSS